MPNLTRRRVLVLTAGIAAAATLTRTNGAVDGVAAGISAELSAKLFLSRPPGG